MSYARMYTDTLKHFLALKDRKEGRKRQIEATLGDEIPSGLQASREHVLNGRLASDPVYKDLQVQMDRAAAEATMYGIGSIIQNLAYLAKEGRKS